MSIKENIRTIIKELPPQTKLVAVSKFKPVEAIHQGYEAGQRIFAESRPQELKAKVEVLPKDIQWHFIGHLQTNKIKMVVPYVSLIHSVDSEKLLLEIADYCNRNGYKVSILLEVFIASEETKQGFSPNEVVDLLERVQSSQDLIERLRNVSISGLMGMASFTDDMEQVKREFQTLLDLNSRIRSLNFSFLENFSELSFGMSNDYHIAAQMGSTMVRVGTSIFGSR